MRVERRHFGRDAAQRFRQRQLNRHHRLDAMQQRSERRIERSKRSRQALGRSHVPRILNRARNIQPGTAASGPYPLAALTPAVE
jgi:hypothetical protein